MHSRILSYGRSPQYFNVTGIGAQEISELASNKAKLILNSQCNKIGQRLLLKKAKNSISRFLFCKVL